MARSTFAAKRLKVFPRTKIPYRFFALSYHANSEWSRCADEKGGSRRRAKFKDLSVRTDSWMTNCPYSKWYCGSSYGVERKEG